MTPQEQIAHLNQIAPNRLGLIIPVIGKAEEGRRGCTDKLAANYDPLATEDDGQCYYLAAEQSEV